MKEVNFNFSLTDFLAYLFPGAVTLVAITGILCLTPYKYLLYQMPWDNILTSLLLIALAYLVGVIISSLTSNSETEKILNEIHPPNFEKEIKEAFEINFKTTECEAKKWTSDHFFAARSLVRERMPACSAAFDRQSSLRQFRRNSIFPVRLLGIAGILTGLKGIWDNPGPLNGDHIFKLLCCFILILISVFGWPIINRFLRDSRLTNRKREVREVCTALLALSKSEKNKEISK
ncbi:MAG TPA: hypothetical protein VGO50_00665 [Pyrinomonadaceae bacterium]|jgi:hypothetical protein|nr:hypothetical protein [Pyrinomonadaceae bacterium]